MIERKLYDLVEKVSEQERSGSFGSRLLEALFPLLSPEIAIGTAELWQKAGGELRRVALFGNAEAAISIDSLIALVKRHKRSNPLWQEGPGEGCPAAVITFGKKHKSLLVFHFRPGDLNGSRQKAEDVILLVTRLVTMFVQRHEERDRLDQILSLSMKQQQRLLTSTPPVFPGFELYAVARPAEEVGGDYYHLRVISPGILAVTIADAKGKGFGAAVQVTGLHHALRVLNLDPLKLESKAERLNKSLCESDEDQTLISAVLGELHQDGRLVYVNASHPYPLLLRCESGEIQPLSEGGLFLGLVPDSRYRTGYAQLFPGDILLMYTDGISEANGGELDHSETIRRLLLDHRNEKLQEIARILLELTSGHELQDDRTVVLLRRVS